MQQNRNEINQPIKDHRTHWSQPHRIDLRRRFCDSHDHDDDDGRRRRCRPRQRASACGRCSTSWSSSSGGTRCRQCRPSMPLSSYDSVAAPAWFAAAAVVEVAMEMGFVGLRLW